MIDEREDENHYSDDYEYTESDVAGEPLTSGDITDDQFEVQSTGASQRNTIIRNAVIVIVMLVLAMLLYKYVGGFLTRHKEVKTSPPVAVMTPPKPILPVAPVAPVIDPKVNETLTSLQSNQQNVSDEVNSVNTQVASLSSQVADLNAKVSQLTQLLSTLTDKLNQQSQDIIHLTERPQPKVVHRVIMKKPVAFTKYYVQAVIPGRAWLVAENGIKTLTVREGSAVPGYGIVRLIDAQQGRVTMSSGQVIRFSQDDS